MPEDPAKLFLRKEPAGSSTGCSDARASQVRKLRIGECWADATTNEIGRGGEAVRVEPKAMEVLMVLARRAGEAVTREELLASVWAGVVVGDEVLTQCVIKLRRALGDSPRTPAYIETISKRGYRLIAPVGEPASVAPAASLPAPAPRRRTRFVGLSLTIAAALVAGGVYVYGSQGGRTSSVPEGLVVGPGVPRGIVTLSVLPFEVAAGDVDQTRLAAGIRNDLMTDLSRLPSLRVIAVAGSPSRREFEGAGRYLVSGSVQREAGLLRIHVRLTDGSTHEQLWSERFERPYGDLFAIQSEISRRLTEQLPGRIDDADKRRVAKRYTHSLEAYEHFLRGQAQFLARQEEENRRARESYAKAIELDPKFARAYAGLAMVHVMDRSRPSATQGAAATRRALELAETALQADPEIPEVHWALGFVHVRSRNHAQAIPALQRAIALNPSYADAYALLGGIYTYIGRPERSIPLLRSAMRLNPDGSYLYYQLLGRAYFFLGDYEQARINLREALSRNAADIESRLYLAATLVGEGDLSSAEWEAEEIRSEAPGFTTRTWLDSYPMTSALHRERLLALAAKVGL